MKYFQLIGGFSGFLLAFGSSISAGNDVAAAVRDGAVGCVCGGLLMRGFHTVLVWSVKDHAAQASRRNHPLAKMQEGKPNG